MEDIETFRQVVEEQERAYLHPKAAASREHERIETQEEDFRLPYQRDVDKILHSKAYARYIDKTQVVYLIDNDHVSNRGLHVQLVSQFARGIGAILRLNLNLVEAIALGHDVGHPPFGHEGEGYLSRLARKYTGRYFAHTWQSCRLFSVIEPLNLGLAVYDGFLCHDGGMREPLLRPRYEKSREDHFKDLEDKLADPEGTIIPMTLEGCLVKMCDTMSYVARDIEDAISLGIICRDELPKTCLGVTNSEILSYLSKDIIKNSYGKDYIAISEEAFNALHQLRGFNFGHIYHHPKLKIESPKIERAYQFLFEFLGQEWQSEGEKSHLWKNFAANKSTAYRTETQPWQMVIDYIAGMTDHFFVREVERLLLPQRIQLW